MGKEREGKRGKYVGLFRSPLGRMASGMVHRYHDCPFFLEQLSRMTLKEQVFILIFIFVVILIVAILLNHSIFLLIDIYFRRFASIFDVFKDALFECS